jgi:hypothetical protein
MQHLEIGSVSVISVGRPLLHTFRGLCIIFLSINLCILPVILFTYKYKGVTQVTLDGLINLYICN